MQMRLLKLNRFSANTQRYIINIGIKNTHKLAMSVIRLVLEAQTFAMRKQLFWAAR